MGRFVLRDILEHLSDFGVEDVVYVLDELPFAKVELETPIIVLQFDPLDPAACPEGMTYFLEISVMREVIEGLEAQIGRAPTLEERAMAVRHYAEYDAYIDPADLKKA